MKNNIVWTLFYTGISCLDILFFYGLSVNVSMFYQGITSAWITLFTCMTMSGALLLKFLIELLVGEKNDLDQTYPMIFVGVVITFLAILSNVYVGCIFFVINVLDCLLKKKKNNSIYSWIMAVGSFLVCVYAYQHSWISLSKYMFLLFIELMYLFRYGKEKRMYVVSLEHDVNDKKQVFLQTVLNFIKNLCVLGILACACVSMIHIIHEGELFSMKRMILYVVGLAVMYVFIQWMEKKYTKEHNVISERFSFILTMIVIACVMLKSSIVLSFVFLLVTASFMALEILLLMYDKPFNKDIVIEVLLCVVLLITQALYDGIYVDYSVVLMSVFMMVGITNIIQLFSEIQLEDTIEEEVEEHDNN